MSHQEASNQYLYALKLGQKYQKSCAMQGKYPYPHALDEMLDDTMELGTVNMGLVEIPIHLIVGTRIKGRQTAFAGNFMPLMHPDTEFAHKWVNLCAAHLGDEGITDPIKCVEYMGKFYVQEGNKRVSVLKSYGATSIPGMVTRILPAVSNDPEVKVYYEFMQFYNLSKMYDVQFSQPGAYAKLQAALGYEHDHVWTADERATFLSRFHIFEAAFAKIAGRVNDLTPSTALLIWLQVYDFNELAKLNIDGIVDSLENIMPELKTASLGRQIDLSIEPDESEASGFFSRFFGIGLPEHLNVAFMYSFPPEKSTWTLAHELGRQYLVDEMGEKISVSTYITQGQDMDVVFEQAVEDGADVIFATTPSMIGACRKIAVHYPDLKVLNCSISMPYPRVRSYYSRIYESKFISGAIAGAMSDDEVIGYVATYPIFGSPAAINAFALGLRMTNPRARIALRWSCVSGDYDEDFRRLGVRVMSRNDNSASIKANTAKEWGLYLDDGENIMPLATSYMDWGKIYVKVIMNILEGKWESHAANEPAVNYWWGMSSGAIDIKLSNQLPDGVTQLAQILRDGISSKRIDPFAARIVDQNGFVRSDGTHEFTPEEIMNMDWLLDNIDGSIPGFEEILPRSREMVRLLGVYRDDIPPEKEGILL
ncbi:MAG: BMP family ABC transporter substrate-binding protein [Clostridiales bacterium]|nr:BMP family ABC transporter substrate-binding protein [Clostridiales bacterium]